MIGINREYLVVEVKARDIPAMYIFPDKHRVGCACLFGGGYLNTAISIEDFLFDLAVQSGIVTVSYSHRRWPKRVTIRDIFPEFPKKWKEAEKILNLIPPTKQTKALNGLVMVRDLVCRGYRRIFFCGYSEAGSHLSTVALIADILYPGIAQCIILLNPVGINGLGSFGSMSISFTSFLLKYFLNMLGGNHSARHFKGFREGLKYFLVNPYRALREAIEMPRCDNLAPSVFRRLAKRGIRIGIIGSIKDKVIDMERAKETLDKHKECFSAVHLLQSDHGVVFEGIECPALIADMLTKEWRLNRRWKTLSLMGKN